MPLAILARRHILALTLVGLVAGPACISVLPKVDEPDSEASVSSVRLTVGSQTITVNNTGTVTGGPITITRPTVPTISASFLNALPPDRRR